MWRGRGGSPLLLLPPQELGEEERNRARGCEGAAAQVAGVSAAPSVRLVWIVIGWLGFWSRIRCGATMDGALSGCQDSEGNDYVHVSS